MPAEFDISILHRAISENTNIFIQKLKDPEDSKFFSRFLTYKLDSKDVFIDFPTSSIPGERLKKKERIKIFFNYRDFRFIVYSTVISKTKFLLTKEKSINALRITLPEKLHDGDRRNFFRVPTPPFPIEISLRKKDLSVVDDPQDFLRKAILHEIAGGGLGFREDKHTLPIENGDQVIIKIHLDKELLIMEGLIRNSRKPKNSTKKIYGIEFDKGEKPTPLVNKNIRRILHYVMKRQRELLK